MKTALVTTTIGVPMVLKRFRELDPAVEIFIAGDMKTPHQEVRKFTDELGQAHYYAPCDQHEWQCSEAIGWNTIQRRNIAILEALKWGAERIVTVDDDNYPLDNRYFHWLHWHFAHPFTGFAASGPWYNPGYLLIPSVVQRGFPYIEMSRNPRYEYVQSKKIGVVQGVILGDPDINAYERIANAPICHQVSELARSGVAVGAPTWTIFNSQNTAFVRELAPAIYLWPEAGRYDDIFACLVTQRIMRELNYWTYFGTPFVWQQRNPHDLTKDLAYEIYGMEHLPALADRLRDVDLGEGDVVAKMRRMIEKIPDLLSESLELWLRDIEAVL